MPCQCDGKPAHADVPGRTGGGALLPCPSGTPEESTCGKGHGCCSRLFTSGTGNTSTGCCPNPAGRCSRRPSWRSPGLTTMYRMCPWPVFQGREKRRKQEPWGQGPSIPLVNLFEGSAKSQRKKLVGITELRVFALVVASNTSEFILNK